MCEFRILDFFFNDTATTEIYTLSLHDALPICTRTTPGCRAISTSSRCVRWGSRRSHRRCHPERSEGGHARTWPPSLRDRKSTRLNSSHANISYAVFCLKKKKLLQRAVLP